jgi:predicted amino acid racemase
MPYPQLEVNLSIIKHNTSKIVDLCWNHGIEVAGVTKGVAGDPEVAKAMIEGGVKQIADSRLQNIANMIKGHVESPIMLLRSPQKHEIQKTIKLTDISLQSELNIIRKLSEEARKQGKKHNLILMVEMGDLREGILLSDWCRYVERIITLEGVYLSGIGVNFSCASGVIPDSEKINQFVLIVEKVERHIGRELDIISGGASSTLPLLLEDDLHERINHLRIGETILFGDNALTGGGFPGLYQNAFTLSAEIIELKTKLSKPTGELAENAFGEKTEFKDKGQRKRAILAVGRQDLPLLNIKPLIDSVKIITASSDYLIVDVEGSDLKVWDKIDFSLTYTDLLYLMTSNYVEKEYVK